MNKAMILLYLDSLISKAEKAVEQGDRELASKLMAKIDALWLEWEKDPL